VVRIYCISISDIVTNTNTRSNNLYPHYDFDRSTECLLLTLLPQGHKPRDAIDVDASDASPASSPTAPHHARLSQISGLDPWAQQAFVHAGDSSASYARASPVSDGTERYTNFGSLFNYCSLLCCSGNVLRRRTESPDDGRLPSLPPALAAGSSVTSAADAAIGSQFPLPQLQQDPQAGTLLLTLISINMFPLFFNSSRLAQ
jgi:hypothetical protein